MASPVKDNMTNRRNRLLQRLVFSLILLAMVMAHGTGIHAATVSLQFETQKLNLVTGQLSQRIPIISTVSTAADIYLAYNAARTPHAVVVPLASGAEIAVLEGLTYELVTVAHLEGLVFTSDSADTTLVSTATVLIRTVDGTVFKLGNAIESETAVFFDYQTLE